MFDKKVVTDQTEMSLREIVESLPDTPTIMNRIGDSWWRFIYAARGGNWDLAGYYLSRISKLEDGLMVLRPKHRERLERFQSIALPAVTTALASRDLARLETAYAEATDLANRLHAESGYPYITWELPYQPPQGLKLGPPSAASETVRDRSTELSRDHHRSTAQ
jgi:hypothetical protein